MFRRTAGIAIAVIGAWLAYVSLSWLILYTGRGAAIGDAVSAPQFFIPFLRAALAVIGGVLAALALRGGVWFAWISAVLTGVLTAMIVLSGGDISLWRLPALTGAALALLSTILTLRHRTA